MTMKYTTLSLLLLLIGLTCCKSADPQNVSLKTAPDASPAQPGIDPALQTQIKEIASRFQGRVGAAAMILETGQTSATLNSQDHFPMQSVYKLPISMAVMKQVDEGKLKLDQKVRITKEDYVGSAAHSPVRDKYPQGTELSVDELLRYALSESDGTASDVLMKLAGGSSAVQTYLAALEISEMLVINTEKEFSQDSSLQFRNYASPESAVALLRALFQRRGVSESSQALLMKYMIESRPGAKRLKGLLPAGTIVAHKTGTSGTEKGVTAATNDIGIVTLPNGQHLAVAVFVADSPADEATREGVIAQIAKAIFDATVNGSMKK